jgi:hypothetical protein
MVKLEDTYKLFEEIDAPIYKGPLPTYAKFTTPDGRWSYGWGEYEKKLRTLIVSPADIATSPHMKELFAGAEGVEINYEKVVPTYYIWVRDPNGQKRIVGEWPFDRHVRDRVFRMDFEPSFIQPQPDRSRVEVIKKIRADTPDMRKVSVLEKYLEMAKRKGILQQQAAMEEPPPAKYTDEELGISKVHFIWPLLAVGVGGYFIYRFMRK